MNFSKLRKAIKNAGWTEISQKGSHIKIYHAGKGKTTTYVHRKKYDKWVLTNIKKELDLSI